MTPKWTKSDGDCSFYALLACRPGTVATRQTFLDQVAGVIADETNLLHNQFNQLFADLARANQFDDYEAWRSAMQRQPSITPLWLGEFELNLWGLLNDKEIRVFKLGNNSFENTYGNIFGRPGAPSMWIAHVSADEPVLTSTVHHANHYIALQQPQDTADPHQAAAVEAAPAKVS